MRHPLLLVPLLAGIALTSVLVFALGAPDPALLTNGDFEHGSDGWQVLGGSLSVVDDPTGADHAAAITLTSSLAFLWQPVTIEPGDTYRLTGTFVGADGSITWVQPSLQAYNGLGGFLGPFAITPLLAPATWSFDVLDVSCDVASGQLRVAVFGSPGATAYIDDIGLKAVPPATPCATDTPTPSETSPPTGTSTPPPTDTPSATPTSTATRTRTATRTATVTRTPTSTRTQTPVPTEPDTATSTPLGGEAVPTTAAASPTHPSTAAPTATLTPSNGLLINGGFEAPDGSSPAAWRHFGGELEQTTAQVHSGDFAALLRSSTASTKWAYQTVRADPGAWYQFEAYVYQNDPAVDAAWLRVSWYASDDASGTALATADSIETLDGAEDTFRYLSTGSIEAPDDAHSANVRIVLRPASAAEAWIAIDDASFDVASPATPTATITPMVTSTPTSPLPTATPTASRTPNATVPSTATRTLAPTGTSTSLPTRVPTLTPAPNSGATPTPTSQQAPIVRTPTQRPRATPTAAIATATDLMTPTPSHGLLVNGGFEAMSGDQLLGWETYGGDVAQVTSPVWSGNHAGAFDSSTDSTKWIYQTVPVAPQAWYTFSAYVYDDDPQVDSAFLRVAWYASGDGSGSAIASADSTESLQQPEAGYHQLTTGSVQAPPEAHSAKARIVLRPRAAAEASIVVDEAWFVASSPVEANAEQPDVGASTSAADDPPSAQPPARVAAGQSSQVEAVVRPAGAVVPQPSPVIRRGSVTLLAKSAHPNDARTVWWQWALPIGVVSALGGVGWGAWWRDRRRAAPV